MRKSLLLLLALTTCWFSAFSSNYVMNASNNAGAHEEQTQSYAHSMLAEGSVFGQFLTRQLMVVNNVENCDGLRVFSALGGGCSNDQINWNIPNSGDGEALTAGFPLIRNTVTNAVVATPPLVQPFTLPVGEYQVEYEFDGDDFCYIPIVVEDNTDPVFTADCDNTYPLPTDADTCIATLPTNTIAIAVGTDNCDGNTQSEITWSITDAFDGVITDTQDANVGGFLPDSIELGLGTHVVTFTITDGSGNTDVCTSTIEVTDNNVPEFVDDLGTPIVPATDYPDTLGVSNDTLQCYATLAFDLPLAIDDCEGNLTVNYTIVDGGATTIGSGMGDITDFQFPFGTSTVTVSATDGNFPISFDFVVEVIDDEAPNVVGCIEDFEVEFATSNNGLDDCTAEVTFPEFLVEDNCSGVDDKFWQIFDLDTNPLPFGGTTFPISVDLEPDTFLIGFAADDNSGNLSEICYARFRVFDDEAPKRIGGAPTQNQTFNVTASCDVDVTIDVPNVGDNSTGCASSSIQGGFFQYITITDLSNGTLVKQDTVSNALINVTETFGVGTFQVTWTAEDYSGNVTEIEQFQISVSDDIDPTINVNVYAGTNTFTANMSAYTASFVNDGCGVAFTVNAISFADNCGVDTVFVNRGQYNATTRTVTDTLTIGTNAFTYTVVDSAGNDVTGTITITLVDDIAPTLNGTFSYPNIDQPVALGQCDFVKTWNLVNFFRAEDNCQDQLDSLIVIYDQDNDGVAAGDTIVAEEYGDIGANQNVTVTFPGPDNTHAIIVVAKDVAGNDVTKSFTVRAFDNQAPELFYQDTVRVFVNSNDCQSAFAEIIFDEQLAIDNCTDSDDLLDNMVNTVDSKGDTVSGFFNIAPTPFHEVVFTTFDSENNQTNKTVVIHVVDTILPGIDLTPIDTIANDQRVCEGTTKVFAPVAEDACGIASVQYSINGDAFMSLPPGEQEFPFTFPVGTNTIVWQVIDDNGNTSLDSQFVTVQDVEAPVIAMIQDIDLNTNPGECERSITIPFPDVTDNCGLDSAYITVSDNNGITTIGANGSDLTVTIEPGTPYTGMVFGSDIYGNRDSIDFAISLEDIETPTITCPASLALGVNTANCDAEVILMDEFGFNPSDNCSDFTLLANDGTQDFDPTMTWSFPVGATSVVLYIEDVSGNIDSCNFDITVSNDIESHVFDFPTDTTVETTANECSRRVFWSEPRIVGNGCNGENITFTRNFNPGQDFPIGTTTVTYTFTRTDGSGNVLETFTLSFDVVVEDNQAPVITQIPANRTLAVGAGCVARLEYQAINYQDNCDAQGIEVIIPDSLQSGSDLDVGSYVVNIIVRDQSGNEASASFTVDVVDNQAPVITVANPNITLCETAIAGFNPNNNVTITDNCGIQTSSVTVDGGTLQLGTNNVTATATDLSGATTTATYTVTVVEGTIATITNANPGALCEGSTEVFTAQALGSGETGMWTAVGANIADATNPTTEITFPNDLTYRVTWTVINPTCGNSVDAMDVEVYENTPAAVDQDVISINSNEVNLNGNTAPGNTGVWTADNLDVNIVDPNDENTLVTGITSSTVFTWTIDLKGCVSSADVTVIPNLENVQTGFTPGASSNSTWNLDIITSNTDYADGTIKVYNRWGNLVFESSVAEYPNNEWDGTNEGSELPTASYYYVIDPAKDGVRVISGNVTIIR